ncbi:MAG: LysR family transcriptional regulator [Burkholderiaceae bacterium]
MINLRQLEAFVAIYEHGAVTRASEHLHVTQSAASRLLSRLERDLGFPLFMRVKGRLVPTDEAQAFYAEIQRNYLGIREIHRAAERIRELGTGTLRLCVMSTLTQGVVPDLVAQFFRLNPEISVTFEVQTYSEVINRVKRGFSEIGIATLPVDERELDVTVISQSAAVCLIPKTFPLSNKQVIHIGDLQGVDYISVPLARFRTVIDRLFEQHNVQRHIRIETRTILSAVSLVAGGAGVCVVDPFSLVAMQDNRIAVRPLMPSTQIQVGLFTMKENSLSPTARRFIQFFKNAINDAVPPRT